VSVVFVYEERPDSFSEHRAGFEIRTRRRCKRIEVRTHAGEDTLVRTYELVYLDELVHRRVVEQEEAIARMQDRHANDTVNFLANKFTSAELYDFMSGILEGVYSFFLQQATAMAKLAEQQLAFERQEEAPAFIRADYWEGSADEEGSGADGQSPDRRGLTGSARLLQDIFELDRYAFDTDKRKLQLTKTISLARLAPVEFQRFRETGVLIFATPMQLFDKDFPGHYLRLIKRVRTSVITLIPPTQGIRATLSTVGTSRVVIGDETFQTTVVNHGPQSVALSAPMNATGLFDLDHQQEMLLPFEGIGTDTIWELRMPRAANPFDYRTMADVLLTIEYTALDSADYRQRVVQTLDSLVSADRPFSFRQQFAEQWFDLNNPDQTDTPMTVRFRTVRDDFPSNLDELEIRHLVLYFVRAEGQSFEVPVRHLRFTELGSATSVPAPPGGAATSVDGVISTRRTNGNAWLPITKSVPVGEWELSLRFDEPGKDREIRDLFEKEEIEDILLVITYSGRTPEWPT
jgi:Tc toxin complex TcA C-terminal TcB-binding domain/Salmonella virulence plasmid 65kDa B protein